MLRRATAADLPSIRRLLARSNETPYAIEVVAEEKCFEGGVAGETEVRVWGDFEGISVTCGKYLRILAVDRARRGRGIGSALLEDAVARGARIAAAEPGNYFTPGVIDGDRATIDFLAKRGFRETASTQNLIATTLPEHASAQRATPETRDRILDFIAREFGPIWRFEAAHAFANDPPTLFYAEHEGAIAGFAAHEANNRGLGFFGPTGVARALRGRGLGRQLLLASLADLRRLGYTTAIIPWTDALDFYARSCGATPQAAFTTMSVVDKDGTNGTDGTDGTDGT